MIKTNKKKVLNETEKLLSIINKAISEKLGNDLINLNLEKIENSITKYFVICHGNSNTHVNAIAENIIKTTRKELKEKPWQKEGFENSCWILLDYIDVVVHIFQKQYRDFYKLEELWGDAIFEEIKK